MEGRDSGFSGSCTAQESSRAGLRPVWEALAYAYFYDQRGGGVETSIKADKQGLGMTCRNKKRFPAEEMLVQLNALAHNVLAWAKGWLAPRAPCAASLGHLRLVRDVFGTAGVREDAPVGVACDINADTGSCLCHSNSRFAGIAACNSEIRVVSQVIELARRSAGDDPGAGRSERC